METNLISVATISWARSEDEDAVLRRSLKRLSDTGLRTAVADAGTSASFTNFLGSLPGLTVTAQGEKGLAAQVKASLEVAARFETPFILYTEPDKDGFFGPPLMGLHRTRPGRRGHRRAARRALRGGVQHFPAHAAIHGRRHQPSVRRTHRSRRRLFVWSFSIQSKAAGCAERAAVRRGLGLATLHVPRRPSSPPPHLSHRR